MNRWFTEVLLILFNWHKFEYVTIYYGNDVCRCVTQPANSMKQENKMVYPFSKTYTPTHAHTSQRERERDIYREKNTRMHARSEEGTGERKGKNKNDVSLSRLCLKIKMTTRLNLIPINNIFIQFHLVSTNILRKKGTHA